MQFLIVRYPTNRTVFVDGAAAGKTNKAFKVEAGRHKIHLGKPRNYTPDFRRPDVRNTTSIAPLEGGFEPQGV